MPHPWHVALASSRRFTQAVAALEGIVDEIFAPTRIIGHVIRGQVIQRPVPYCGPAVFARWSGDDAHLWHEIRDAPGITAILGGEFPTVVPDDDIERARAWIAELEARSAAAPEEQLPCAAGDLVRFSYLAFYDLAAPVRAVQPGAIELEVELLGVPTRIFVPYSAITSVEVPAAESAPLRAKKKKSGRRRRRAREAAVAIAAD
jgi:transcription termination factor NusG